MKNYDFHKCEGHIPYETFRYLVKKDFVLSKKEFRRLISKAKKGDAAARNKIIEAYMKFAVSCAAKFNSEEMPFPDKLQEAVLGICDSISNYDCRQAEFTTYSHNVIRNRLIEKEFEESIPVKMHTQLKTFYMRVKRFYDAYVFETGEIPSCELVCEKTNVKKSYVESIFEKSFFKKTSLDSKIAELGKKIYLGELLESDCDVEKDALKSVQNRELYKLLSLLKPIERQVIERRYGFCELNGERQTFDEICEVLKNGGKKITRQGVQKIEKAALAKLKKFYCALEKTPKYFAILQKEHEKKYSAK